MAPTTAPEPARPRRGRIRWSKVVMYTAGAALVLYGGLSLLLPRSSPSPNAGITHEIMPGLEPVDRIAALPGALKDWNVLFVTFDTTRADHVGCYGNEGVETPVVDQLAREGILCANAVTPVPATLPGHSSLLTGLYPFNHGARANGTFRLEEHVLTVAEILREHSFRTAAVISAYVLDEIYGTHQGFELYHDDLTRGIKYAPNMFRERAAELANEAIMPWLRAHAHERFFCWIHYFDPHATYLPPEPFRTDYAHNLYDGEIAYADSQLGEVLDLLSELGVRDRTLIVMTSDHGEGLSEHNEQTHSLLIYDATLCVPLILHAPGVLPQGKVIERQVSLVDVVPTVLDLLGIDAGVAFDGISLLQAAPAGPRACYIETLSAKTLHGWAPLMGVRRDDYKYILAPRPEVYDLRSDPRELTNLYKERPDLAVDLHEVLKQFLGDDPVTAADVPQNLQLDADAREKLAALGYVVTTGQGGAGATAEEVIDPKDGVLHWEKVHQGIMKRDSGDLKGAIEILEACIAEVPKDVFARQSVGNALLTYGEPERALVHIEKAIELESSDPTLYLGKASCLVHLREFDQAEQCVRHALELQPDNSAAYMQLGNLALSRRRPSEGMELLQKALEIDRGSRKATILKAIGDVHMRRGEMEEARQCFAQAIELDVFHGEARAGLAELDIAEGNNDAALRHLHEAIRFNPVQPRALAALSFLLSEQGRTEEAIRAARQALALRPNYGPGFVSLGLAYRREDDLEKAEQFYREGIEKTPDDDALHQNLAQLLLRQGRVDEAAESFKEAVRRNRFNVVALANIGVYYMQNDRPERARRFLQRAIQIKPGYALAHKHLGVLLLQQNRVARAMFHLQRSLELDPDQPEAGKIRLQLERFRNQAVPPEPPPEELGEELEDLPLDDENEEEQP